MKRKATALLLLCVPWLLVGAGRSVADDVETCRQLIVHYASAVLEVPSEEEEASSEVFPGISVTCPLEAEALMAHSWSDLLSRPVEQLSLVDLEGFYTLYEGYLQGEPRQVLDSLVLPEILSRLDLPAEEPPSLWQRMMRWLVHWFEDQEAIDLEWMENFSPSEKFLKTILYGSVAMIVLMALGIILVEVRAAGTRRRQVQELSWDEQRLRDPAALDFSDLNTAPLNEQPGMLLRIVLHQLQLAGWLNFSASLTHRDIAAVSIPVIEEGSLAQLSRAAERATFGGWIPVAEDLESLLEVGSRVCRSALERPA